MVREGRLWLSGKSTRLKKIRKPFLAAIRNCLLGHVLRSPVSASSVNLLAEFRAAPSCARPSGTPQVLRFTGVRAKSGMRRITSEANVSTKSAPSGAPPRLSPPYEQSRRPSNPARPAPPGTQEAVGLIWRIRTSSTFKELRLHGTILRQGPLEFCYQTDGRALPPRVAFAVGRRVGSAVLRNRLRRRLREILRRLSSANPDSFPSGDYLVRVSPAAASLSWSELELLAARAIAEIVQGRDAQEKDAR